MFRRKEYDASAVFFYYSILQRMMFALAHSKEKPITYDKQNPLNEDLHKKLKFEICNRIRDGKEAKSVGELFEQLHNFRNIAEYTTKSLSIKEGLECKELQEKLTSKIKNFFPLPH
jgi:hypothetical protein